MYKIVYNAPMSEGEYYLRQATKLADDWCVDDDDWLNYPDGSSQHIAGYDVNPWIVGQYWLDALAAQLRRQINATKRYAVHVEPHLVIICSIAQDGSHKRVTEWVEDDGDESWNTIKATIDSGVLAPKIDNPDER